jgi:hypothetical protein
VECSFVKPDLKLATARPPSSMKRASFSSVASLALERGGTKRIL